MSSPPFTADFFPSLLQTERRKRRRSQNNGGDGGVSSGSLRQSPAVSGSLRPLADKVVSLSTEELTRLLGVEDEIRRLGHTLSLIEAVLEDAEEKQFKDRAVEAWLRGLRDAAYDADDVLDEFLTEANRRRRGVSGRRCSSLLSSVRAVPFRRDVARRIVGIREILAEIAEAQKTLNLQAASGSAPAVVAADRRRESSSLMPKRLQVFGRENEKKEIIDKLLFSDDEGMSLIPIVGMGGIGKTTLAQVVFDDDMVKAKFPNIRVWLHVGQNFDARRLIMEILGMSPLDRDNKPLEHLHRDLVDKLKDERFLIVLDDVWSENREEWKQLWTPLTHGGKGWKVVVTSRSQKVPNVAVSISVEPLKILSDEGCWLIFEKHAFVGGSSHNRSGMEYIGRDIARKLKGIPLAAEIAGGFLRDASDDIWISTLQSQIWPLEQGEDDIMPILRLSYHHLSAPLKQCFMLCSAFPKNYKFEKTRLVHIWMAHDLIQPQSNRRIEDIGSVYFEDLTGKSFFQYINGKFTMHDLIHDLAQSISKEECMIIREKNSSFDVGKVRHLSFYDDSSETTDLRSLNNFKKLRTLMHIYEHPLVPFDILPRGLFSQLSCLRILDLSLSNIQKLPESIQSLKHLRYLDLTSTGILKLPKSVCNLYNLQTLRLGEDHCKLPKGMSKLVNLRHLEADARYISKINGIGRLTSLQELKAFSVGKKNGHKLKELKNMTQLRQLSIWNLENVSNRVEAREINMKDKSYFELELIWNNNLTELTNNRTVEEVLEGLQPPTCLRSLKIKKYYGFKIPRWIGSLCNLVSISLNMCRTLTTLPPLGHLRSLKDLEICGFAEVKEVGPEFYGNVADNAFPLLENLVFDDMAKWEKWFGVEEGQFFPSLCKLNVHDCPRLTEFPNLPFALSELKIVSVGLQGLSGFCRCDPVIQSSFPSLSSLTIVSCHSMKTHSSLLQHHLKNLQNVTIVNCEELMYFWEGGSSLSLNGLKILRIENCPKLIFLAEGCSLNLRSLSTLELSGCSSVDSLPDVLMRHLKTLERLEIRSCRELALLDLQGLSSLRKLSLQGLGSLRKLRITDCIGQTALVDDGSMALTSLTSIEISGCPSIMSLPVEFWHYAKNLEVLVIKDCKELVLLNLQELVFLKRLCVDDCPKLDISVASSSQGQEGGGLSSSSTSSLEILETNNKPLMDWLLPQNLVSLDILLVDHCPQLTMFIEDGWQNLTSLRKLYIYHCENLKSLPTKLRELSTLEELWIVDCPQIEKLPDEGLPNSLTYLWIRGCPKLMKSCQGRGCPDRHKVAHIHSLYID